MMSVAETKIRVNGSIVKDTSPATNARGTDRQTEILFRALSNRVARRWRFVSFRGIKGVNGAASSI